MLNQIKQKLQELTTYQHIQLTSRGNTAIKAALQTLLTNSTILIPEEGGWLTYKTLPEECGLQFEQVRCKDGLLDLEDLQQKVESKQYSALLYHGLGGYSVEEPIKEIYDLCKEHNVTVILDTSGTLGTELCNGSYADIIVGGFGRWKAADAGKGGFIATNDAQAFAKIQEQEEFADEAILTKILEKLTNLTKRLTFLLNTRKKIIADLEDKFEILHKDSRGLVVLIPYKDEKTKDEIVSYCNENNYEYTECPRYIRINRDAISIEVKRL